MKRPDIRSNFRSAAYLFQQSYPPFWWIDSRELVGAAEYLLARRVGQTGAPRQLEPYAIEEALAMAARPRVRLEILEEDARAVTLQNEPLGRNGHASPARPLSV